MPAPRKPLSMQKGNLTVLQQEKKQDEEKIIVVGREQLSKPPSWVVGAVAKKEFTRIVKELNEINVVGNLDLNNLGGYCNSYSMYLKATKELSKQAMLIKKFNQNGTANYVENPLINIQKKYAEEMRKFASLCGLTIDSRLKVATIKTTKTKQEIEQKYGNI